MTVPRETARAPRLAALVCPDCGGAISVHTEGDSGYLVFTCQVGHAYSPTTLIAGKEEGLEQALWAAVYLLEELAGLLDDLAERGGPDGGRQRGWPAARRRVERLREHARRIRTVLDENEPIDLGGTAVPERDAV